MKIFFVKLNNSQVENLSKSELKKLQSQIGRKIVDFVARQCYSINDREIVIKNNKPKFKNSELQFSISHSNQIITVAFDEYPVGLDVEFMKERDFKRLGEHYNINTDDKYEFYKKWTQLEAEIKLQAKPQQIHTEIFESEYMLTVMTTKKDAINIEKQELRYNNL